MARSIFCVVLLFLALSVVLADDRALPTEEDERRWNTPPELIPEQFIKESDVKNERSLILPIITNVNVNGGGSNAHSLGFQLGPEGLSYSESNSFNHPLSQANGGVSQSQSASFSAGLTGISGAVSEAASHHFVHGNQGNVNGQALGFGSAAASSSGSTQNGHATTSAASSVGSVHSSASSSVATIGFPQGTTIRFPEPGQSRPVWTNIRPNNNGYHPGRMPKLDIEVKPHREQNHRPIMLHVSAHETRWDNRQPKIHIHKWQPSYRRYYDNDDDEQI